MAYLVKPKERILRFWMPRYDKKDDGWRIKEYAGLGMGLTGFTVGTTSFITLISGNLLVLPLGGVLASLIFTFILRPALRIQSRKNPPALIGGHMHVSNCETMIIELAELKERYYRNKLLASDVYRERVQLDERTFEKRIWQIALDLWRVDNLFRLGRRGRARLGNTLEQTLTRIRQDVGLLGEAVDNLNDINILETTNAINDSYIDPTMSEILATSTRMRLQGVRELVAAPIADATEPVFRIVEVTDHFGSAFFACDYCKQTRRHWVTDNNPDGVRFIWSKYGYCEQCGTRAEVIGDIDNTTFTKKRTIFTRELV